MSYRSSRGNYKEIDQPYTDGWKRTSYSEHVHPPVIVDAEGRQMPIISYSTGQNGESYVVKTEIIRHIVPAPYPSFVPEYGYSTEPGKEEVFRDYGVNTHVTSAYDRPEKVEEFLTKVLDEASQPIKAALPLTSSWHSGPKASIRTVHDGKNKYVDDRDFKGSDRNQLNGNPTWGQQNEPYLQSYIGTNPMNSNKDVYDRPRGNKGSYVPSRPLSKPTHNVDSAMEFITEAIKPAYGNKEEFTSNVQSEVRQPPKAVPLSTNRWRSSSNLAGKDSKMESNENDLEKQNQHARRSKPEDRVFQNNGGAAKPFDNTDGYEKPSALQAKFPSMQKKEKISYPETIDSTEASRRYGKSSSPTTTEGEYEATITCREAVKKYNGALLP